jgi:DNA-binding PadR family transcriptional regulator
MTAGHARDVDSEDAVDRVDARLRHRAAHPDAVGGRASIEEGSLYPALRRMLVKGWVLAEWKISANNRRARFYTLTPAGKKQLGVEEARFSQMFGAIMRVMKTT